MVQEGMFANQFEQNKFYIRWNGFIMSSLT